MDAIIHILTWFTTSFGGFLLYFIYCRTGKIHYEKFPQFSTSCAEKFRESPDFGIWLVYGLYGVDIKPYSYGKDAISSRD